MEQLSQIPNISYFGKRIIRVLGMNPSKFTLQGTNTYLIDNKLLIDTGEGKQEYLDNLRQIEHLQLDNLLITHHHYDHVGGIQHLQQIYPHIKIHKYPYLDSDDAHHNIQFQTISHKQVLELDNNLSIQCLYTPGHCCDHLAFYFPQESALFCGDIILGEGSAVIDDLESYLDSLQFLQSFCKTNNVHYLLSAHGKSIEGNEQVLARIEEYYSHRIKREEQVLNAIWTASNSGTDIAGILKSVYPQLKDQSLINGAIRNIKAHLNRLQKQNKIREIEGQRFVCINNSSL